MSAYKWTNRYGFNASAVEADTFGATVEKLRASGEEVDADAVLRAARAKSSPIHDLFTWDDTVAGEKWRRREATQALVALVVVQEDGEEHRALVFTPAPTDDSEDAGGFIAHADLEESQIERVRARLRGLVAQARATLAEFERLVKSKPKYAENVKRARRALAEVEEQVAA